MFESSSRWRNHLALSGLLVSIVLGQVVSLMDTLSALYVKLLASRTDIHFPILQYIITYFVICVVAAIPFYREKKKQQIIHKEVSLIALEPSTSDYRLELTPISRVRECQKLNPNFLDTRVVQRCFNDDNNGSGGFGSLWTSHPLETFSLYGSGSSTTTSPSELLSGCGSDISTASSDSIGSISVSVKNILRQSSPQDDLVPIDPPPQSLSVWADSIFSKTKKSRVVEIGSTTTGTKEIEISTWSRGTTPTQTELHSPFTPPGVYKYNLMELQDEVALPLALVTLGEGRAEAGSGAGNSPISRPDNCLVSLAVDQTASDRSPKSFSSSVTPSYNEMGMEKLSLGLSPLQSPCRSQISRSFDARILSPMRFCRSLTDRKGAITTSSLQRGRLYSFQTSLRVRDLRTPRSKHHGRSASSFSHSNHQSLSSPSTYIIGKKKRQFKRYQRSLSLECFLTDNVAPAQDYKASAEETIVTHKEDENGNNRSHKYGWSLSTSSNRSADVRKTGHRTKDGFHRLERRDSTDSVENEPELETCISLRTAFSEELSQEESDTQGSSGCLKKPSKHNFKRFSKNRERSKELFDYINYQRDRLSTWLWTVFSVGTPAFYILLGFLDVQGGTFSVVAFEYANLASCCLIDWVSLLTAFVLSVKFMGEKATRSHIIALLVGLLGSLCILLSDSIMEIELNGQLQKTTGSPASFPVIPTPYPRHKGDDGLTNSLIDLRTALEKPSVLYNSAGIASHHPQEELMTREILNQLKSNKNAKKLETDAIRESHEENKTSFVQQVALQKPKDHLLPRKLLERSYTSSEPTPDQPVSGPSIPRRAISKADRLYGDVMCLLAATFLGSVTVMMEKALLQGVPSAELLFKSFFPAFVIGVIEFLFFESQKIKYLVEFQLVSWVYLILAALSMSGAYVLAPVVLQRSSSAFFNLSLLTSAGLAVLFSAVLLGDPFPPLYSIGLVCILGSLVIYHHEQK